MIMSYCIAPTGGEVYSKEGKLDKVPEMFDYGACFYPEGMVTSDQLFAFNHDQIDRVCFKGYETDKYHEVSKALNDGLEEMKKETEEKKEEETE